MKPNNIKLAAITRANRHNIIDHTMTSINQCSAWIINHTMYSNMAICINFQIEVQDVPKLISLLNNDELILTEQSLAISSTFSDTICEKYGGREILGSINITFIHNEKDLKIKIPSVPG